MTPHESKFAILFRHWLRKNPMLTAAIETKDTRGKSSLPFSEVSQAQIDYGMAIKSDKGVLLRVQAVSEGMPDYIYMRNEPSFIIIRYPAFFCAIDVETFVLERDKSKRRSLTGARAKEISILSINI